MADIAVRASATAAAPRDYTIPGAQELLPKVVSAHMDGSSAATAWFPCLQVVDPGGNVMFSALSKSVAAGASVDASWFPGVTPTISSSGVAVVGARIEAHSAQSVPDNTATDLVYDTVAFDTAGMTNLGTDPRVLTVTTDGLYLLVVETIWTYNNAGRRLNAATHNNYFGSGGAAIGGSTSPAVWTPVGGDGMGAPHTDNITVAIVSAVAGDFFASGALQSSGGALNANGPASGSNQDNFLSAILLGTT